MPTDSTVPPNVQEQTHTSSRAVIGFLVLLLLGIGGWLYLKNGSIKQTTHADFYSALTNENSSFAEAERLARENRYAEARPLYEQALQQATNDEERLQIQLLLARTMSELGDYAEAVPLLKEIIATSDSLRTARGRALAAAEIAHISSLGIIDVNGDIFKDEPFQSLWVANDPGLTLRHEYEYAASIYPIALAQLRIAQWHAVQLPDVGKQSKTLADETIQTYVTTIQQRIASADQDIAYLQMQGAMARDYHAALLARAIVIGDLNRHGDISLGNAHEQYMQTINAYKDEEPGQDGIARYYYAIYIAHTYGVSRKEDVQAILNPLSTPPYAQSPVIDMLKTARTISYYRQFPKLLAKIDPTFKELLVKLGWTEDDFTSS